MLGGGRDIISYYKYTDKEIDELILSIIILVDTREKMNAHITDSFDQNGISYKKKALEYGDYSFALPKNEELSIPRDMYFNKKVCIERKASLEEISGNLFMPDNKYSALFIKKYFEYYLKNYLR